MNKLIAIVLASAIAALCGCASNGGASNSDARSAGSSSGVTVFGTIDTSITGVKNK